MKLIDFNSAKKHNLIDYVPFNLVECNQLSLRVPNSTRVLCVTLIGVIVIIYIVFWIKNDLNSLSQRHVCKHFLFFWWNRMETGGKNNLLSVVHSIFLKNWTGRFVTSNIQLRNLWSAVAEPTSVAETGPMLAMLHACIPGPLTCQVPSAEWFLLAWSNSSTHGAFCWSWIVSK